MSKILVVEDVDYLRNDVVEFLRYEGFEVRGAPNGRIGLEVAREFIPNLVICDIMMPEMNGREMLRALRSDPKMATIPFIFLTAKTDPVHIREGMNDGAEDYLTKPYLVSELIGTIHARLERARVHEEAAMAMGETLRQNIAAALPHELRTPLNTIMGFSEMLMTEAPQLTMGQIVEWAQHINQGAMRLYRLIENYLTYVRIELIGRNLEQQRIVRQRVVKDPARIIELHAMGAEQEHPERLGELDLDLEHSDDLIVSESDLNKIMDELLDNAYKFSSPGQRVRLEGRLEGNRYLLRFIDRGRGMTAEQIAEVGAYMQFDRVIYEQQGAGLGLIIAKRLLELYGGGLEVTSEVGQGTTVTTWLLLADPAPAGTTPTPVTATSHLS